MSGPQPSRARDGLLAVALPALLALALLLGLARTVLGAYFTSDVAAIAPTPNPVGPRLARRGVLIVIDGLRKDSALEWHAMPRLEALARGGASGVALTGPITMTFLGVRALGSGVTPGLADLVRYGRQPPITLDSPLRRLHERGDHIAIAGDGDVVAALG